MGASFPRQLPRGVDADAMAASAGGAGSSMTAIAIIQLVGSMFMKGALDDIWSLFLILQLCAYMSIYETNVPANSEIYMGEFRKMVKFEILKPDNLVGIWVPGFKLQDFLASAQAELSGSMESSG